MPKGEHLKGGANAATRFSADRQPDKYRQPDSITALIKQELAGPGWATFEDAELIGEDGKPTGQKVAVRIKITTMDAIAKKILQRAMKSSDRLMEQIWERIDGKVPQHIEVKNVDGIESEILTPAQIEQIDLLFAGGSQQDNEGSTISGKQKKQR